MKISLWLWVVALVVAALAARYQRTTGPTVPITGEAALGAATFRYSLPRTHAGDGDQKVDIRPGAGDAEGVLEWQLLGAGDAWTRVPMRREGESLRADLPHQPMTGKLAYRVTLARGDARLTLPARHPAVIRFRGDVPPAVLLPHILAMIAALLLGARGALEVFNRPPRFRGLTDGTLAALLVGGFVLGPLVSWYAFHAPWGGFPLGNDPTDNKTLLAFLVWLAAAIAVRRAKRPGPWVVFAALVMFAVYLVPHSISMPR